MTGVGRNTNREFTGCDSYQAAHGVFLSYVVSDHNPVVLHIKNVKEAWKKEVHGYYMYRLVKKLKNLKRPLKKLSWKQRNVFDNVVALKERPKSIQANVDKNPHDASLKKEVVIVLNDFVEASKDEMKILQHKAKVSYEGEAVPEQFVIHFEHFLRKVDQVASVEDSLFKSTLDSKEANNMI
ncbi:hypothetical protein Tco_1328636, partial [Tanacetum coccineum]